MFYLNILFSFQVRNSDATESRVLRFNAQHSTWGDLDVTCSFNFCQISICKFHWKNLFLLLQYAGIRIGPVVKKDVMKASIMLEHDSQWVACLF